jgi:cytochrome oxidase Cu insertion factor (SCO1/SenC/PrrC family)
MDRDTLIVVAVVVGLFLRAKAKKEAPALSQAEIDAREAEAATFEDEDGNPLVENDEGVFVPAVAVGSVF